MAKVEIAQRTGLSGPAVSAIVESLESEGLLVREPSVRGRMGQPSVPFSLGSDGALFFGLKIGRRSSELVLVDLTGEERACRTVHYRYPRPWEVIHFVADALEDVQDHLSPEARRRLKGMGVAVPFEIWNWPAMFGLPSPEVTEWRNLDLAEELSKLSQLPISLQNDASAACNAELVLGGSAVPDQFLYIYLGYFVGGGLVIDRKLHTGKRGNAAALASMPSRRRDGQVCQLLEIASIATLERTVERSGLAPIELKDDAASWQVPPEYIEEWLEEATEALADCIATATALLELEAVIVDGWLPPEFRTELVNRLRTAVQRRNMAGMVAPVISQGRLGGKARALGAATLLLSEEYILDGGELPAQEAAGKKVRGVRQS